MKFFLDENFPRKAVDILVARGHTVFDIRGTKDDGRIYTYPAVRK